MVSQTKPLKVKPSLSFNFAITKICVMIRLAEDGEIFSDLTGSQ